MIDNLIYHCFYCVLLGWRSEIFSSRWGLALGCKFRDWNSALKNPNFQIIKTLEDGNFEKNRFIFQKSMVNFYEKSIKFRKFFQKRAFLLNFRTSNPEKLGSRSNPSFLLKLFQEGLCN